MSDWTYSGDPSSSVLDEVRFHLGDVDEDRPILSNAEINYWITQMYDQYGSAVMVAAYCADSAASRTAIEVSQSADGVSIAAEQLQDKLTQLAASLRDQYQRTAGSDAVPYVGSNDTCALSPGERPGWAAIGMHDNVEAGTQDNSDTYPYFYGDQQDWVYGW